MCLVLQARPATEDVDALLIPSTELRNAALAVARAEHLPDDWLNDAVKGFFSENSRYYAQKRYPARTRYVLEELLGASEK